MARSIPKTKAGKARKVANVMGEFKSGDLKSSSGQKVKDPKQAIAIALNQTGQSKPPSERDENKRVSDKLTRRIGARDK